MAGGFEPQGAAAGVVQGGQEFLGGVAVGEVAVGYDAQQPGGVGAAEVEEFVGEFDRLGEGVGAAGDVDVEDVVGPVCGGVSRVTVGPNAIVVVVAWVWSAAWARIHAAEDIGAV